MAQAPPAATEQPPRWRLERLFADAEQARAALEAALERARRFAARPASLAGVTPAELAALLDELGAIENALRRAGAYASLRRAVDVDAAENRDLQAQMERAGVEAANLLRPFRLAWLALDDEEAERLAGAPELARDRHHLLAERRYRPHTLSEPEERMLAERSPSATGAWQSLFQQLTSTLSVPFDGGEGERPHTIAELLAYVSDGDRERRREALRTLYAALEPHAPVLAHCYDSLVADRLVIDRLRSYGDDPMQATHLANELPGPAVAAMLDAVERAYAVPRRWFAAKARLLGLERLELWDQYAPLGEARRVGWDEARASVLEAMERFSPQLAEVAGGFFADGRIDAEPRLGKRGGAFCARVAQDAEPYLLMNFTGRLKDVLTLGHELGHGMHFTLAGRAQSPHSYDTGLALAEVPSTFAEFLTYELLLERERDPQTRRVLLAERAEGTFATVYRQTVLARYEQEAYRLRAGGRALTGERLAAIWLDANRRYYGDAVALPEGYRLGWSYIPHFVSTRFYTYAYVFAELVALVLLSRYHELGSAFAEPYARLLAAGGSGSPAELLADLDVDIEDPAVWRRGLAELERMVAEAEAAAA